MASLMLVAAGIAAYMTYVSLTGSKVAGCGGGGTFNCDHVITSAWGKAAGVPVGLPAAGMYSLGILVAVGSWFAGGWQKEKVWPLLGAMFWTATAAGVWFIGVQIFAIGSACSYCLAAHSCGGVLLALYLVHRRPATATWAKQLLVATVAVGGLIATQLLTEPEPTFVIEEHASMIGTDTQVRMEGAAEESGLQSAPSTFDAPPTVAEPAEFTPPVEFTPPAEFAPPAEFSPPIEFAPPAEFSPPSAKSHSFGDRGSERIAMFGVPFDHVVDASTELAVRSLLGRWHDPGSAIASTVLGSVTALPVDAGDASGSAGSNPSTAKPKRMIPVSQGRRQLAMDAWPLWGDPNAERVIVKMFDYTCPHCRRTHQSILEAQSQITSPIAVLALPVPLYRGCNSHSQTTDPKYASRCDIAKVAVAAWMTDPAKFTSFHDWMMQSERTLSESIAEAESRFGREAFQERYASPVPGQYVDKHVFLYGEAGAGTLPKLVFPNATVTGEVGSGSSMADLIRQKLGS